MYNMEELTLYGYLTYDWQFLWLKNMGAFQQDFNFKSIYPLNYAMIGTRADGSFSCYE